MTNAPAAAHDTAAPKVSIGLPVYNGERYLRQALDALLGQTFPDFELIIADNASTDATAEICRHYAARDRRIRYIRHPSNIGADPNHHFVVQQARGRYFKWAGDDDLYEPDFLRLCVEALETHPEAVLAHARDGIIDENGELVHVPEYRVDTANPRASGRLRSLLYVSGGNDDYGLMYTDLIRRVPAYGTGGYGSDRVFIAAMALQGPFHHVPEILYFRRDHPHRISRAGKRDRALVNDPRRGSRRWNPMPRMHLEYVMGYCYAIWQAPLPWAERLRCWREVAGWALNRMSPVPVKRFTEADVESAS